MLTGNGLELAGEELAGNSKIAGAAFLATATADERGCGSVEWQPVLTTTSPEKGQEDDGDRRQEHKTAGTVGDQREISDGSLEAERKKGKKKELTGNELHVD